MVGSNLLHISSGLLGSYAGSRMTRYRKWGKEEAEETGEGGGKRRRKEFFSRFFFGREDGERHWFALGSLRGMVRAQPQLACVSDAGNSVPRYTKHSMPPPPPPLPSSPFTEKKIRLLQLFPPSPRFLLFSSAGL